MFDNKRIKEAGNLDKLLNSSSIKRALERILVLSKSLTPDEQRELSQKLAKLPLTKSSAVSTAKSSARKGGYFEAKKGEDEPQPEPEKKTKEAPIQSYESEIKGNQHFRQYLLRLKTIADPAERAASVGRLIAAIPKQNDKFKQALKRMLER